jgi:hypothetical protein
LGESEQGGKGKGEDYGDEYYRSALYMHENTTITHQKLKTEVVKK